MSKKTDIPLKEDMVTDDQDLSDMPTDDAQNDMHQVQVGLDELQDKLMMAEDQLKRAVADYHNLEKRVAEGRSEFANWATGELIQKILPAVDNLEKTVEEAGDEEKKSAWFKGVEMSVKQLKQTLKEEGLEEIEIDPLSEHGTGGTRFDPALHEAIDTRDPAAAEAKEGRGEDMILEVVQKGYNLNGKIFRPAKVVVGRKVN